MQNDAKREPKWEPKSIQNSKNIGKKGMQKFIPKIDAFMDPEMSYKGTKGGAAGGKEGKPPKAALRNASFLSLKRLTPAGVGGFRAHFWRPFGTL